MTGSLIDAVFGDAAAKGIKGFDLATAYEGLKKHATNPGRSRERLWPAWDRSYLKLGYVPVEAVGQSVAETVDAAYGDFCIRRLQPPSESKTMLGCSSSARATGATCSTQQTGFLRGKHESGAWLEPFDEFQWGSPYVEGSAWQHRWDVPQDISGLIAEMGGEAKAVAALDRMLALPPVFHVGVYGQEIHEMSEMAAVRFWPIRS